MTYPRRSQIRERFPIDRSRGHRLKRAADTVRVSRGATRKEAHGPSSAVSSSASHFTTRIICRGCPIYRPLIGSLIVAAIAGGEFAESNETMARRKNGFHSVDQECAGAGTAITKFSSPLPRQTTYVRFVTRVEYRIRYIQCDKKRVKVQNLEPVTKKVRLILVEAPFEPKIPMYVILEKYWKPQRPVRKYDRTQVAFEMHAEITFQFESAICEPRSDLWIVEVPMASNCNWLRHKMQNVIYHGSNVITMRGTREKIWMNPQFHAALLGSPPYRSTLVRDEKCRFDKKLGCDFEEMLNAVFRRPIQICGQNEIHRTCLKII